MQRRRIFAVFLVSAPFGWLLFWAVFHNVPGQDWVVFHTAAALFRAHDAVTLADPRAFTAVMNATHLAWFPKPISVLHPWVYPPVTLLLALAFGWMPYLVSLFAFLGVTMAAMMAALWQWQSRLADRLVLVFFVLLCPATAFAIGAGQLSFLIASAVLAGMMCLERRPFLAGAVFSLLCLKPQFVPLIPVALVAGRHWRAVAGAIAGGLGLVLVSVVIVGLPAWLAWIAIATGTNPVLGKLIDIVRVYDQSVHTCLRTLGLSEGAAGIGQSLAMAAAAVCVWIAFARPFALRQRLIVLLCALVAGAPHVGDYDHVLLASAAVLVLLDTRRLLRGEGVLAGLVWVATLFNPPALIAALGVAALTDMSALSGFLPFGLMVMEAVAGWRREAGFVRSDGVQPKV